MDEMDPFLAVRINQPRGAPNCNCSGPKLCAVLEARGMAGEMVRRKEEKKKQRNSHLEVAADEELASHGDWNKRVLSEYSYWESDTQSKER